METNTNYLDYINRAFTEKKLFFKPWVGSRYDKGLRFRGASGPLKLLVIGASRYCGYSYEQEKSESKTCRSLSKCCNVSDYDVLMKYACDCPYAKQYGDEFSLYDINSASISSNSVEAYLTFQKKITIMLDEPSNPKNFWQYCSFINYLQIIVWGDQKGNARQLTPKRSNAIDLYEQSEPIIGSIISILQPDCIILWGISTFRNNSKISNNKLFSSCNSLEMKISEDNKKYTIILNKEKSIPLFISPHPSSRGKESEDWDLFYQDLEAFFRTRRRPAE